MMAFFLLVFDDKLRNFVKIVLIAIGNSPKQPLHQRSIHRFPSLPLLHVLDLLYVIIHVQEIVRPVPIAILSESAVYPTTFTALSRT
jgi:hypothetical protein